METSQALPLEAYIRIPTPRSNTPSTRRAPAPPRCPPPPAAKTNPPLRAQGAPPAAQSDHRNGPGLRVGEGEVAIRLQRGIGVDDPLAIRAEHPDAVLLGVGEKRRLELRALLAHLAEPGGVDDDRLD